VNEPITVVSSMATRPVLAELGRTYELCSARSVAIESVGGGEAARRVRAGEKFDNRRAREESLQRQAFRDFLSSVLAMAAIERFGMTLAKGLETRAEARLV
jgi:hypothetical protein